MFPSLTSSGKDDFSLGHKRDLVFHASGLPDPGNDLALEREIIMHTWCHDLSFL